MVDIQGLEDFFGDMDFKVGGTHKGITAIQMDLKIDGLTPEIIREAFAKTHTARNYILDEVMLKALPTYRPELSQYAPKMQTIIINPDKIRDVIGSGGKVIQKICAECDVKIDIEEDGHVLSLRFVGYKVMGVSTILYDELCKVKAKSMQMLPKMQEREPRLS